VLRRHIKFVRETLTGGEPRGDDEAMVVR